MFNSELFKDIQDVIIDPSLQDNVLIQRGFFQHIYHIGCASNLHSIINNGLIPGGQDSSRRQTVFFLPIDPRDKGHQDPEHIDFSVPRRAPYLHNARKKHQDAVYWVDINLAIRTHDWTKELGSKVDRQPEGEVTRQPEGEVARQAKFFQPTQPIPNPIRDRSGRLGITKDVFSVQACSSGDSKSLNVEQTHDRSGQLGKDTVAVQDDPEVYHEAGTLNIDDETLRERIEADMDFKIPGLPHSTVKQLHGASVRDLIQKIENHPNRHALQRDLRQNQSFNPFSQESKESKQMIRDVGNIELCELLETEPKTQCKVCLSYWDI